MRTFFSSHRFDHVFFPILGVLISVVHLDVFYYAYDTPKWFIFDLALSLYALCNSARLRSFTLSKTSILAIATLISTLLMSFKAVHISMAIEFTYRLLLTLLTIQIISLKHDRKSLIAIIEKTVFISALSFVVTFYIERYIFERSYNVGSFSTFGFINNLGQVFNIWLPVLIALTIKNMKKPAILAILLPVNILCVSILMEASVRACIFGLFLGEGLVFLIMLARDFKKALLFLSTSIALACGIIAYTFIDSLEGGKLSSKLSEMENAISASQARLDIYANTLAMIKANPMGVGTNNFEYFHPKYGKPGQPGSSPYVNEHQILRTPHNFVLKVYSEQGVIGGSLMLALLALCYLRAIYQAFYGGFYDRWVLVALTALLFHSMLSAVFLTPASLYFALFIFAFITTRHSTQPTRTVNPATQYQLNFPKAAIPSIAILTLILSTLYIASEYYSYRGFRTYNTSDLKLATALNPSNDRAWYTLAHIQYRKHHDIQASLNSINKFVHRYPYHIAANQIKSERLYQLKRYDNALENTRKLLNYYPGYQKAQRLEHTIRMTLDQGRHPK